MNPNDLRIGDVLIAIASTTDKPLAIGYEYVVTDTGLNGFAVKCYDSNVRTFTNMTMFRLKERTL